MSNPHLMTIPRTTRSCCEALPYIPDAKRDAEFNELHLQVIRATRPRTIWHYTEERNT